jgi:hypothetical protein
MAAPVPEIMDISRGVISRGFFFLSIQVYFAICSDTSCKVARDKKEYPLFSMAVTAFFDDIQQQNPWGK